MVDDIAMLGDSFGRLHVIGSAGSRNHNRRWVCRCECGAITEVTTRNLRSGKTRSCGCLVSDTTSNRNLTHGHTTSGFSPEYYSWAAMISRCYNPNTMHFRHYGGRGITVCDEWRDSFEAFLRDMGTRPKGTSIDRIDNNAGYAPGNCRWATADVQATNKRAREITAGYRQDILILVMAGHGRNPELFSITKLHPEVVKKEIRKLRRGGLIRSTWVPGKGNGRTQVHEFCGSK